MSKMRSYKATAPSNIALIKYWGKEDEAKQWPANDSLSMTLADTRTSTTARILVAGERDTITLNGQVLAPGQSAYDKAQKHLDYMRQTLGCDSYLGIESQNNFPSDCGIASSASGFAALTIAAIAAWRDCSSMAELADCEFTPSRLANLARMGSGSASRSLMGGFVTWLKGETAESQTVQQLHDNEHWHLCDTIAIVSDAPKPMGSTAAHKAAWESLLFKPRLAALPTRMLLLQGALAQKDLQQLGELIEADALEMHSVIMTAHPAINYLQPETSELITWIRQERQAGNFPGYFTIDAGPNVHILSEGKDAELISKRLRERFPKMKLITDRVGSGPTLSAT